jgi:hypothetical protein
MYVTRSFQVSSKQALELRLQVLPSKASLVAFGDFVSDCAVQALGAIGFSRQM